MEKDQKKHQEENKALKAEARKNASATNTVWNLASTKTRFLIFSSPLFLPLPADKPSMVSFAPIIRTAPAARFQSGPV